MDESSKSQNLPENVLEETQQNEIERDTEDNSDAESILEEYRQL